jgi:hypothetical protein
VVRRSGQKFKFEGNTESSLGRFLNAPSTNAHNSSGPAAVCDFSFFLYTFVLLNNDPDFQLAQIKLLFESDEEYRGTTQDQSPERLGSAGFNTLRLPSSGLSMNPPAHLSVCNELGEFTGERLPCFRFKQTWVGEPRAREVPDQPTAANIATGIRGRSWIACGWLMPVTRASTHTTFRDSSGRGTFLTALEHPVRSGLLASGARSETKA